MSKLTLNDVGNLIDATTAATTINNNNQAIEDALENTFSRDGTSPNYMSFTLDMNSNPIINLPAPISTTSPMRLADASVLNGGGTVTGLPNGGTIGQVLSKISGTDYDVSWGNTTSLAAANHWLALQNFDAGAKVTQPLQLAGSTSGTTVVQPAAVASGTITVPSVTDTLVGKATTDTLTNKTLTAPVISTITNTGTLTLPTSTDTLVGRATTDTLTNKTLTSPVISTISNTGTVTLPTATTTLVGTGTTDTLTNKSINASNNTLTNIPLTTAVTGTLPVANGGTGVATIPAFGVMIGNGTGAVHTAAVPSIGTVLSQVAAGVDSAFTAVPVLGNSASAVKGTLGLAGNTSGTVSIVPQAAAGTYNFNLPITAGSAGQVLTSQGGGATAMTWAAGAGVTVSAIRKQVFTASGTYTRDANLLYAIIECLGPGGGGGGVANSAAGSGSVAGGGGSGGYSRLLATVATIGASQTVTIGTVGAGGANTNGNGGNGTATSVGTLCIANGGTGGLGGAGSAGGAGGTAGTGDLTITGNAGGTGGNQSVVTFGVFVPGRAPSYWGGGAQASTAANTAAGTAGGNYGGGGGPGVTWNGTGASVGGAGGPGIVHITEFCSS